MVRRLADGVDAAARLAGGDARTACGAANLVVVDAYRLAATAADGEAAHAEKVSALRAFVAVTDPASRPFRAALIDAALAAEVDARVARGAPFLGRRLRGWMDASAPTVPASPTGRPAEGGPLPQRVIEARAEAADLDDVDVVLLRTLALTRALRTAAERREPRDALVDEYEGAALALCVGPPASGAVDDARWLLLHHWTFLRRRRPLAAVMIRARIRWARTARPIA